MLMIFMQGSHKDMRPVKSIFHCRSITTKKVATISTLLCKQNQNYTIVLWLSFWKTQMCLFTADCVTDTLPNTGTTLLIPFVFKATCGLLLLLQIMVAKPQESCCEAGMPLPNHNFISFPSGDNALQTTEMKAYENPGVISHSHKAGERPQYMEPPAKTLFIYYSLMEKTYAGCGSREDANRLGF